MKVVDIMRKKLETIEELSSIQEGSEEDEKQKCELSDSS